MGALTGKQNGYLKGLAHSLKPLVQTGKNGISEAVVEDIASKLAFHELIKVKISCNDAAEMKSMATTVADKVSAELVQVIGHTAILYKTAKTPKIKLP